MEFHVGFVVVTSVPIMPPSHRFLRQGLARDASQAGLHPLTLLLWPPQCWDCRHTLLSLDIYRYFMTISV